MSLRKSPQSTTTNRPSHSKNPVTKSDKSHYSCRTSGIKRSKMQIEHSIYDNAVFTHGRRSRPDPHLIKLTLKQTRFAFRLVLSLAKNISHDILRGIHEVRMQTPPWLTPPTILLFLVASGEIDCARFNLLFVDEPRWRNCKHSGCKQLSTFFFHRKYFDSGGEYNDSSIF